MSKDRRHLWDYGRTPRKVKMKKNLGYFTAIENVRQERIRQDKKWGEQNHAPEWWLAILMEEVGELSQAILEAHFNNGDVNNIRKEAVHSAAVALAMIECIDRNTGA